MTVIGSGDEKASRLIREPVMTICETVLASSLPDVDWAYAPDPTAREMSVELNKTLRNNMYAPERCSSQDTTHDDPSAHCL